MKTLPRRSIRYKMWKNSLYKWDSWIANRHNKEKDCDDWSRYVIDNCKDGKTATYNCGGLFFTDFLKNVTVIESTPGPIAVPGMQYISQGIQFYQEFDNLIMANPLALKYHSKIIDFLMIPGISRAGFKPNIFEWVKPGGRIFLSTSDWHLYYDRLKFTTNTMIDQQLKELKQSNINCIYREIGNVNNDIENGNIKLVFELEDSI